jgi:hypothetical protein
VENEAGVVIPEGQGRDSPFEAMALAELDQDSSSIKPDRRERPRRRPSYTQQELEVLRILRVFLHGDFLVCLLSDRNTLFVPLRISPVVASSQLQTRYQWQIAERGKALVWSRGLVEERLRLPAMLAYPGAEISSMG